MANGQFDPSKLLAEGAYVDPNLLNVYYGYTGTLPGWAEIRGEYEGPAGQMLPTATERWRRSEAARLEREEAESARRFAAQQEVGVAGLTGLYQGQPTLAARGQQAEIDYRTRQLAQNLELAGMNRQTSLEVARMATEREYGVERMRGETARETTRMQTEATRYTADLNYQANMAGTRATQLYQAGQLAIQQGNLALGYAQLQESTRQFGIAQDLGNQAFQLQQASQVAQMAANPRNWVAMAYLARGYGAPAEAYQWGLNPLGFMAQRAAPTPIPSYLAPTAPAQGMIGRLMEGL